MTTQSFLSQLDSTVQCMPCGANVVHEDRKLLSPDRETRVVARCDKPIHEPMSAQFDAVKDEIQRGFQSQIQQYIAAREENETYRYNSQIVRAGKFSCVEAKRPIGSYAPKVDVFRQKHPRPDTVTLQLTDLYNQPLKSDKVLFGPVKRSVRDLPAQPLGSVWRSDETVQGQSWMGCLLWGALSIDVILHIFTSKAIL